MKTDRCIEKIFASIFLLYACLLLSCSNYQYVPTLKVDLNDLKDEDEIRLTTWQLAGPFLKPTDNRSGFDHDYLVSYGGEQHIDAELFAKVNPSDLKDVTNNFKYTYEGAFISLAKLFKIDTKENYTAYLACYLDSTEDRRVAITLGSSNGIKVWLNHNLLISKKSGRQVDPYSDIAITDLKKGRNFVLVKLTNNEENMGFSIRLIPSLNVALKRYLNSPRSTILDHSILKKGDFNLSKALIDTGVAAQVQILNKSKEPFSDLTGKLKENWNSKIERLSDDLYYCRISLGETFFETPFYLGDADQALSSYQKRYDLLNLKTEQISINLGALFIRYKHLLDPANRKSDDPDWQAKVIMLISEFEYILSKLENNQEPFRDAPGVHLRGFTSKIDGQIQYYRVTAPSISKQQEKGKLPIVVTYPPAAEHNREYLKSVFVAGIAKRRLEDLSNKYGYLLLHPSARGNGYGNPIAIEDIFQAIEAVKQDYNVDEDRIYLDGGCEGGLEALLLGARYPSKFAAIGVSNPMVNRTNLLSKESDSPVHKFLKDWIVYRSPMNLVENLSNVPIIIIHDNEGGPKDPPVQESINFIERCKRLGFKPTFEYYEKGGLLYDEVDERTYTFFQDKARIKSPTEILYKTRELKYSSAYWVKINRLIEPMNDATIKAERQSNRITVTTRNIGEYELLLDTLEYKSKDPLIVVTNGEESFNGIPEGSSIVITVEKGRNNLEKTDRIEGPILHAFSDSFMIVDGSIGSKSQGKSFKEIASKLKKYWKDSYFVDCKYKEDSQVTIKDIEENNLILIGTAETNSLIERIRNSLPIEIFSNRIRVGTQEYVGTGLGLELIYPNPLNKKRYVVIITGNDPEHLQVNEKNLAIEGWYDYQVWKVKDGQPSRVVDVGYFDSHWAEPVSLLNNR
jgi:pimeloyl-ACP methyl ester carboxylesterase